ncbi:protein FAR-RED ELONGATED HYPOCOTYL 1-like [Abrus precatorius]|uniref:Protein FAR-RED ELONGATED HYPOCOTYL 1-like n=1 Tax=Abrus precatorius TaxID=3816 RepID=A0A8B8LB37_ABRPR|nr:protein FAR-RED ELONGATED HYPOCOTYL 1-like [Abrus precatorius]
MEEKKGNTSQVNRFEVDGMDNLKIIEWKKKRKLQTDQLDLLRPKHKCWLGSFSSEHASMFNENPALDNMHNYMIKSRMDAAFIDDGSQPESAKDSNSFIDDFDTAMSVNEEAKHEADCGNAYLYVNRISYSEEEAFVDSKCNPSYDDPDIQALKNHEELLGLGSLSGHEYSEHAKDSNEHSVDTEFEDFLFSNGVNPNMYVLSSGRWEVNQEAQSNSRPPTIDQEFEEYFSMLML